MNHKMKNKLGRRADRRSKMTTIHSLEKKSSDSPLIVKFRLSPRFQSGIPDRPLILKASQIREYLEIIQKNMELHYPKESRSADLVFVSHKGTFDFFCRLYQGKEKYRVVSSWYDRSRIGDPDCVCEIEKCESCEYEGTLMDGFDLFWETRGKKKLRDRQAEKELETLKERMKDSVSRFRLDPATYFSMIPNDITQFCILTLL